MSVKVQVAKSIYLIQKSLASTLGIRMNTWLGVGQGVCEGESGVLREAEFCV